MEVLARDQHTGLRRERRQHATRLFLQPNDDRGVVARELATFWIEPEVSEPNESVRASHNEERYLTTGVKHGI